MSQVPYRLRYAARLVVFCYTFVNIEDLLVDVFLLVLSKFPLQGLALAIGHILR